MDGAGEWMLPVGGLPRVPAPLNECSTDCDVEETLTEWMARHPGVPEHVKRAIVDQKLRLMLQLPDGGVHKELVRKGRWFQSKEANVQFDGELKACFTNAINNANTHANDVVVGYGVPEKIPLAFVHAANFRDGCIVETTPGWDVGTWYFVVKVSVSLLENVAKQNTPANPPHDVIDAWRFLKPSDRDIILSTCGQAELFDEIF